MLIHPNARTVVSKLSIPLLIKKYFSKNKWEIDLSNNTNPYVEGFCQYPDIQQKDLKNLYLDCILSLNTTHRHLSLTPDNVLFTVRSMEGIDILLRTFCEPNQDTICILQPTFSAYEHWSLIHNLEVKNISLLGKEFNTFSLKEIIHVNPKMVFICNPNNPIGTSLESEMIEELCQSIHGLVVIDEAYIEFSDRPSAVHFLAQYKNLIILRTFSKAWGLAGARCGIILADQTVIHALRYIQLPFGLSSPTRALVHQCLSYPKQTFSSWERIKRERQRCINELSALEAVDQVFNSETNFLMVVFKDSLNVLCLLKEHKIQVLDCSASIPHALRVSLGTEEQNEKFVEVIRRAGK